MARFSVSQTDNEDQTIADINWEEESYQQGCACAREQARLSLEALDAELLRGKPKGWTVLGFRERTMVTKFGKVVIRRRLYRDPDGQSRFALDEHFGWESHQQASPSLTESIVTLSAQMPPYQVRGRLFGKTATTVSALTAGVLSTSTVYRLLRAVGQSAIDDERSRWEACFERGEDVCEGEQRVDVLYTEADGVWVHLQREERTHYEVKSGIAYRGWRCVGDNRYELVGKRVYGHASESIPFWEGASLEWGKQYALEWLKLVVVGGDGANWIHKGVGEFARAVFQLDGFHLARACGRGYGRQIGAAVYDGIRAGSTAAVREMMSLAPPPQTERAQRDRAYIESNLTRGMDWRKQVSDAPPDARSLGTMESNGDKLIANRMKKRGMSWTIRGAHRMAKVVQLVHNGELAEFCRNQTRRRRSARHRLEQPSRQGSEVVSKTRVSDWAAASVPALSGPHCSRPWTNSLRNLVQPTHLLN